MEIEVPTAEGDENVSKEEILSRVASSMTGININGLMLDKREAFAAMAMQGLVSSISIHRDELLEGIAFRAVKYADALIKELEKSV